MGFHGNETQIMDNLIIEVVIIVYANWGQQNNKNSKKANMMITN